MTKPSKFYQSKHYNRIKTNILGIKDGDTIEWIIRGDSVIVRKSIQGIGNVRDRFNRLRKRAPECFVYDEKLEESELVKGLERWALAKLGLME